MSSLETIEQIAERGEDVLQQVVDVLHDEVEHYSWVGIYLVEGDDLVLGPWRGPQATEHVRIPVGQGVCGAAAASGETEIVDDVNADPRYLACFPSTRSEIVVPIAHEGRVVGEIDIDSDRPGRLRRGRPRVPRAGRVDGRARSVTRMAPRMAPLNYLDAGSGSMLLQIVLGGVAAIGVTAKMTWRRVLRTLRIRRDDDELES